MENAVIGAVLIVGLSALLFLICRVIVLWYWRVNETVALLKSIDKKLGAIADNGIRVRVEIPSTKALPAD